MVDGRDFYFEIFASMVQESSDVRKVLELGHQLPKLRLAEELHRVGLDASFFYCGGA